jgi:hypothetical protein
MAASVNNFGLPEGFVLDTQPQQASPALPPGFVLDTPTGQESALTRGMQAKPEKPLSERGLIGSAKRGGQAIWDTLKEGYKAGEDIHKANIQRAKEGKPLLPSAKTTGALKFVQSMFDPESYAGLMSALTEEETGEKKAAIIPSHPPEEYKQKQPMRFKSPEDQKGPATAFSDYLKKDMSPEEREAFDKQERQAEAIYGLISSAYGIRSAAKNFVSKAKVVPKPKGPTTIKTRPISVTKEPQPQASISGQNIPSPKSSPNTIRSFFRNLSEAPTEIINDSLAKFISQMVKEGSTAEEFQAIKDAIKEMRASGIQADLGYITGNNEIQGILDMLGESSLAGPAKQRLQELIDEQFLNEIERATKTASEAPGRDVLAFETERALGRPTDTVPQEQINEQFLNSISPTRFATTEQAGRSIARHVQESRRMQQRELSGQWEQFKQSLGQERFPLPRLTAETQDSLQQLSGNLGMLSPKESALNLVLRRVMGRLVELDESGNIVGFRPHTIQDLIEAKQSIGSRHKWPVVNSNTDRLINKLFSDLTNEIRAALPPEKLTEFEQLNSLYTDFYNRYNNQAMRPLYSEKHETLSKPSSLYKKIATTPDLIRALQPILEQSEEGTRLLRQIRRDYAQKNLVSAKTPQEPEEAISVLGENARRNIERYVRDRTQPPTQEETLRRSILDGGIDKLLGRMGNPEGIRELRQFLRSVDGGQDLFNALAAQKIEDIFRYGLTPSENITPAHLSRMLRKQGNREILKELLGNSNLEALIRLEKNLNKMRKVRSKFYNASKSATKAADVAVATKILNDMWKAVTRGKFYNLIADVALLGTARKTASILFDPQFIRNVEDLILAVDHGAPTESAAARFLVKVMGNKRKPSPPSSSPPPP